MQLRWEKKAGVGRRRVGPGSRRFTETGMTWSIACFTISSYRLVLDWILVASSWSRVNCQAPKAGSVDKIAAVVFQLSLCEEGRRRPRTASRSSRSIWIVFMSRLATCSCGFKAGLGLRRLRNRGYELQLSAAHHHVLVLEAIVLVTKRLQEIQTLLCREHTLVSATSAATTPGARPMRARFSG